MKTHICVSLFSVLLMTDLPGQLYVHDFTVMANPSNSLSAYDTGALVQGSLILDFDSDQLVISLTNLSATADGEGGYYNPGHLTAFEFYHNGLQDISLDSYTTPAGKDWIFDDDLPFLPGGIHYDGVEANNPKNGSHGNSLYSGETGTFYFSFTHDVSVHEDFFLNNGDDADLWIRWQATLPTEPGQNEGSDKVRILLTNNSVPEPGTYGVLSALALLGLALGRRMLARS